MLQKLALRKKAFVAMGTAGTTACVSTMASAIDTVAVGTAITAAETDALTTGEFVIGTVASLVVIGLIIAIVKKI
jgi:hypothetical protein